MTDFQSHCQIGSAHPCYRARGRRPMFASVRHRPSREPKYSSAIILLRSPASVVSDFRDWLHLGYIPARQWGVVDAAQEKERPRNSWRGR